MEDILKAISTYGLALVISGVVIYFAIQFGHVHLEKFKQKRLIQKHDELAILRKQISSTINALLERTVLRAHADRVYVFELHNGTTSMGGLPFLKMTNTYEALGEKAQSQIHNRENMPMQMYSSFIDAIYNNDYIVMDVENRTQDYSKLIYETLAAGDIKITVRCKISDLNKKVIGYVGIDFCNGNNPREEDVYESVKIVQDTAIEVGALLTVK